MSTDSAFVYMCCINATTWASSDHKQAGVWAAVWIGMAGLALAKQCLGKEKQ